MNRSDRWNFLEVNYFSTIYFHDGIYCAENSNRIEKEDVTCQWQPTPLKTCGVEEDFHLLAEYQDILTIWVCSRQQFSLLPFFVWTHEFFSTLNSPADAMLKSCKLLTSFFTQFSLLLVDSFNIQHMSHKKSLKSCTFNYSTLHNRLRSFPFILQICII